MKGRQYAVCAAIISLVLGSFTISSAAPISACPFSITAGGNYTLVNDLFASGDCITIDQPAGASVTVQLNGFSIFGDGTGLGIFAPNSGSQITVVGPGTIAGFEDAIDLEHTTGVTVKRLNIFDVEIGIDIGQGSVTDSVVSAFGYGVFTEGKTTVTNVTATGGYAGIFVGNASAVSQSTANNNAFGIVAGPGSIVKNCTANDNSNVGVTVSGRGGTVTQCTTNNNGTGIVGGTKSNINTNTVRGNGTGIEVNCPSTVQQNKLTGNTNNIVTHGSGCTVRNNVTSP